MREEKSPWFPFGAEELQGILGVYGCLAAVLALLALPTNALLWGTGGYFVLAYMAGLLVHSRTRTSNLTFIPDGAIQGLGSLEAFRQVERCLYLMHLDDDPPGEELLALYRRLLEKGIQIRRLVFLRSDAAPGAYDWIVRFGDHRNLQHRLISPQRARAMRMSFVVVDDQCALVSVPGMEPIDRPPYTKHLVLRHLLKINDPDIATLFQKIHEDLWELGSPINSVAELSFRSA